MPEPIDPELASFADDLRGLAPRAGGLDRDVLLFAAGRVSAKAGRWRAAAAGLAALSLALGVLLAARPAPPVVERVVHVPVEPEPTPEPPSVAPPPTISRDRLIEQVFLRGLDGLPEVPVGDAPPPLPALDPY